ncbi:helix-turn-helix domain-containing protein [Schinkia azotoformans]|uniref:helix-turn-helix domain-containing protein n=1 Tax=Schinkia azotoformans TaxID=1454 RepID=UPI002DB627B8|nr:helix-turn-helix transcriptional regulator [Schinkia azotoformans]MEC1772807.1 helix-turn-helix transcriptional regulator [Schinkia azotoformans]MED4367474.1 helix-turn-helix transcriptional regulator [Schinkia azotoformans]
MAKIIKSLAKQFNLQMLDIADHLGISKQALNDFVNKDKPIPQKHIPKLVKLFGVEEDLLQKDELELTEEERRNIDFGTTLHKHSAIIRSIEKKRNIEGSYSAEDINNLVISLYYKMVLMGIDDKELGTKLDALKKFLYLMIDPYDKDIPHVLWEVIDNIFDVQDEYYYELTKLNRKYWDE